MPILSEKLNTILRGSVPYCLIFALFIFNVVSVSSSPSDKIEIPFVLMMLFYWSIYRPALIPIFLVFLMGVCFDLLSATPLGLSAFIFLLLRHLISEQRVFLMGQPFIVIWFGYVIVSMVAVLLQWGLFGLMQLSWPPFLPIVLMWGAGIFCFPAVAAVLTLSHKLLPALPDQYSAVK